MSKPFGTVVRRARRTTQADLASRTNAVLRAAGLPPSLGQVRVSMLERGVTVPRDDEALALTLVLNLDTGAVADALDWHEQAVA